MNEEFIKEGIWSTSLDFDKEKIYGKLIYSKIEGIKLELRGVFDLFEIDKIDFINIFGLVDNFNQKITLFRCHPIKWSNSYIDLNVKYLIINDHIEEINNLKIKSLIIEYFGLQDYIKRSGINIDLNESSLNIKYTFQPKIEVSANDTKISIMNGYNNKNSIDRGKTGNKLTLLKEYVNIKYEFDYEVDINISIENSEYIASLFSLISNNIIYPININLILSNGKKLEYLYSNAYFKNNYDNDEIYIIDINEVDLENLISTWINYKEKFKTFLDYIRTSELYNYNFNENRFLDSLAVLETYHRTFCDNSIDKDIKETIDALLTSNFIPEHQLEFFKNRLCGGKSNYQKYLELYKMLGDDILKLINENPKKYCTALKDSRNAYTHNQRERSNLLRNNNMLNATHNNEALLRFLLLQKIGIENDKLIKEFKNIFRSVTLKSTKKIK